MGKYVDVFFTHTHTQIHTNTQHTEIGREKREEDNHFYVFFTHPQAHTYTHINKHTVK